MLDLDDVLQFDPDKREERLRVNGLISFIVLTYCVVFFQEYLKDAKTSPEVSDK